MPPDTKGRGVLPAPPPEAGGSRSLVRAGSQEAEQPFYGVKDILSLVESREPPNKASKTLMRADTAAVTCPASYNHSTMNLFSAPLSPRGNRSEFHLSLNTHYRLSPWWPGRLLVHPARAGNQHSKPNQPTGNSLCLISPQAPARFRPPSPTVSVPYAQINYLGPTSHVLAHTCHGFHPHFVAVDVPFGLFPFHLEPVFREDREFQAA